jgi:hypothetical protein
LLGTWWLMPVILTTQDPDSGQEDHGSKPDWANGS